MIAIWCVLENGHGSYDAQLAPLLNLPASADAALSLKREPEITAPNILRKAAVYSPFQLLTPKMLVPTLTYINCDAKLSKS